MTTSILLAGFGGQGILFAGKFLAYQGLFEDKKISWLPSYGPEMRGGTANCSVIISDDEIGSPIIATPDVLMVMNRPSFDKYVKTVAPGGKIFVDSSLIDRESERRDVDIFYVPATAMAREMGVPTLANMILTGKMIKETGLVAFDRIEPALRKVIPEKHADMIEINLKAIKKGFEH